MTSNIKHPVTDAKQRPGFPTSNIRRHTPIPGLADHIAAFTNGHIKHQTSNLKHELASIRAAFADRVYAASVPRGEALRG